jgi:hypothetical protein
LCRLAVADHEGTKARRLLGALGLTQLREARLGTVCIWTVSDDRKWESLPDPAQVAAFAAFRRPVVKADHSLTDDPVTASDLRPGVDPVLARRVYAGSEAPWTSCYWITVADPIAMRWTRPDGTTFPAAWLART